MSRACAICGEYSPVMVRCNNCDTWVCTDCRTVCDVCKVKECNECAVWCKHRVNTYCREHAPAPCRKCVEAKSTPSAQAKCPACKEANVSDGIQTSRSPCAGCRELCCVECTSFCTLC